MSGKGLELAVSGSIVRRALAECERQMGEALQRLNVEGLDQGIQRVEAQLAQCKSADNAFNERILSVRRALNVGYIAFAAYFLGYAVLADDPSFVYAALLGSGVVVLAVLAKNIHRLYPGNQNVAARLVARNLLDENGPKALSPDEFWTAAEASGLVPEPKSSPGRAQVQAYLDHFPPEQNVSPFVFFVLVAWLRGCDKPSELALSPRQILTLP